LVCSYCVISPSNMYPIYEYLGYCATTNQLLHSLVDCTTILCEDKTCLI
jgi:hypothetical protein